MAREANAGKVEATKRKKLYKMEKRAEELNKRYPNNKYVIKESKAKTGMIKTIVRTAGVKPHKQKDKNK